MNFARRGLLALGAGLAAGLAESRPAAATAASGPPEGAQTLQALTARLAEAPRRRDFKTVPMILDRPDLWDHEALSEVIAYRGGPRQVWDNTEIGGPWLNLMRNAVNNQVWSFRHPDFLAASATHGSANIALYDQAMWDKYQFTKLAGESFKTNTLIEPKSAAQVSASDYQDPAGMFSPANNSIPALMARGVVFLSCHNAIWEQAAALIKRDLNPDRLSHEALAADLTNHLIPGVILTPGAVGTLPELQQAGFHYAK
ncbi:transcriptional initiation protein Tat [Methylobacterium sp. C33D]|uniref:thiosulfate dehydrogenase n=1 Tax=Methylobacterium mesophilicum TaxID=39956 RepID=UPI002F2FF5E9